MAGAIAGGHRSNSELAAGLAAGRHTISRRRSSGSRASSPPPLSHFICLLMLPLCELFGCRRRRGRGVSFVFVFPVYFRRRRRGGGAGGREPNHKKKMSIRSALISLHLIANRISWRNICPAGPQR
jgi:hypothetical protein